MVRTRPLLVSLVLGLGAAPLAAQANPQCSPYQGNSQEYNVCNAAIDGTVIFHPVLGLLVSGGNATIGTAHSLGGFPHFALTVRVNATKVNLPDLNYDGISTTVASDKLSYIPSPIVEASLGVFKGLSGGLLAIDLLASAQLLPTTQIKNLTVDPNARHIGSIALGLGYGAKIGVLDGNGAVPAVSVTAMRRDIPMVTYGDVPRGDRFSYGLDLHATNLRATAGYKLALLSVAAGLGWDKYTGDAKVNFRDPITNVPQPEIAISLDRSRTMVFVDAALDLSVLKIAAEAGYQLGKAENLATTFQGNDPSKSRFFLGAGLRFSF